MENLYKYIYTYCIYGVKRKKNWMEKADGDVDDEEQIEEEVASASILSFFVAISKWNLFHQGVCW